MARRKTTEEKQSGTVNLIRAVLSTEVKFIIGIVGFVMGVVAPYYQMRQDMALIQKDIATINTNHLAHTQDLAQSIKDTIKTVEAQQTQINTLNLQQAVILEKLSN